MRRCNAGWSSPWLWGEGSLSGRSRLVGDVQGCIQSMTARSAVSARSRVQYPAEGELVALPKGDRAPAASAHITAGRRRAR